MKTLVLLAFLTGVSGWTWAQKSQDTPEVRTTVVVVGAPDALAEENSARSTRVLGIEDRRLARGRHDHPRPRGIGLLGGNRRIVSWRVRDSDLDGRGRDADG